MRRGYPAYLIVAVLPALAAVAISVLMAQHAWAGLQATSWEWVGVTALNAFQADLVESVDSLGAVAQPTVVNPEDPAWERVSGGGTVSALRPRASGAEVMVLRGPSPGDSPGTLRYAAGPVPASPLAVARTAGSRLSLYLNGRQVLASPDSLGPDSIPGQTLLALSASAGALVLEGGAEGALVALDHRIGLPPSVVVLVAPVSPPARAIPVPILLVTGLLFLFACLTGWIQFGTPGRTGGGQGLAAVMVFLVPVLTAAGFLVNTELLFRKANRDDATRNLTRALAVSTARGVAGSPGLIHELTGFDATLIRDGEIEETTLVEPLDAVAGLPDPPPSFTSSGSVLTSEGPSYYVALRRPDGSSVVASARRQDHRIRAFRRTLLTVAGGLVAWLAVAGWMAGLGEGTNAEPRRPPPRETT